MNEHSQMANFSRVVKNYSIASLIGNAFKKVPKFKEQILSIFKKSMSNKKADQVFLGQLVQMLPEEKVIAKSIGYQRRGQALMELAENYSKVISKATPEQKEVLDKLTRDLPDRLYKAQFDIPAFLHDGEQMIRHGDSSIKKLMSFKDAGKGFMVNPRFVIFDEMLKQGGPEKAKALDKLLYPDGNDIQLLFSANMERGMRNLPETFSKVVKQHFPDVTKYCGF